MAWRRSPSDGEGPGASGGVSGLFDVPPGREPAPQEQSHRPAADPNGSTGSTGPTGRPGPAADDDASHAHLGDTYRRTDADLTDSASRPVEPAYAAADHGAPQRLGPYDVTGRWHAEDAGQVLSGRGPAGEVELVVLGAGPLLDAAVRDRFAAAVERSARSGQGGVVDADPRGPVPWVALRPGSGPAAARPLLDAAHAGPAVGAGHRGPAFQPYWSALAATYPQPAPSAPAPAPPRDRRWWLALAALVVVLLLLLAACWPTAGAGEGGGDPTPGDSGFPDVPEPTPTQSPTTAPPSPTPSPSGSQSGPSGSAPPGSQAGAPQQPLQEGPGVSGPSFAAGDDTREMRLAGVPFPFRVPATWECSTSSVSTADSVRWVCFDAAWTRDDSPPGGVVEVQACGPPCDSATWDALRLALSDDTGWRQVDVGTLLAEDAVAAADHSRLRMSRIFSAPRDGTVDTHVYVELSAPTDVYALVQAVANDIRANTP